MNDFDFSTDWTPNKSYLVSQTEIDNWVIENGGIGIYKGQYYEILYTPLNTGMFTVTFRALP